MGVEEMAMIDAGLESDSVRFIDHHIALFVQSSQRIFQARQIDATVIIPKLQDQLQRLEKKSNFH